AAGDAEMLTQLFEGGIGMLLDETAESFQVVPIECGIAGPPPVQPRFEGAGPAAELEQPGDGRDVDGEATRDLASRSLVVVDGGEDSLSEVAGKRSNRSPPGGDFTSKSCATWA